MMQVEKHMLLEEKRMKVRKLVAAALLAALACGATMVIQIPSPIGGYLNLGDCIV